MERNDVIVIASVSCIYGLGSPDDYMGLVVSLRPDMLKDRDEVIKELIGIQYDRNDLDLARGCFRVRGDAVEISPALGSDFVIRIEFFGDEIDRITEIELLTGKVHSSVYHIAIFQASHYVVAPAKIHRARQAIEDALKERIQYFKGEDKLLEAR